MPLLFDPPDDPRDTRDWTREVEEIVAGLVVDVLTAMVTQATDDYIATFGPALTAAGDLSAFDGIPGQWQTFVVEEFADTIGGIYLNGALTSFVQAEGTVALTEAAVAGWTAVVNQDAVAYSQVLQNRMRDVGDRLWLDLRETVTRGITEGMSIDNLSTELQKVSNFGRYRAEMIARTEVHASMNAGKIEGDLALGEYGPVEKVWLSGRDARVRETHVSADGQYVSITEPFTVGGAALMFPGDPAGPAREVINCRCTYLRLWPGDERPDGSIVPERVVPEQIMTPKPVDDVPLTTEQIESLQYYSREGSASINSAMRRGVDLSDADARHVGNIRDAMRPSTTEITVHRAVDETAFPGLKPHRMDPEDWIGRNFTDDAFMSTSTDLTGGSYGGTSIELIMRVPPGTPMRDLSAISSRAAEQEILLGDGLTYVVRNATENRGRWLLEVDVLPRALS